MVCFYRKDPCCTIDWYHEGAAQAMLPIWTMSFVIDEITPQLKKEGVSEEQVQCMMCGNVSWFEVE
jgi:phosphotriesterase-related protein